MHAMYQWFPTFLCSRAIFVSLLECMGATRLIFYIQLYWLIATKMNLPAYPVNKFCSFCTYILKILWEFERHFLRPGGSLLVRGPRVWNHCHISFHTRIQYSQNIDILCDDVARCLTRNFNTFSIFLNMNWSTWHSLFIYLFYFK